ncbi:hypothetical protein V6N13_114865 [Hibiscus sabdariffa]
MAFSPFFSPPLLLHNTFILCLQYSVRDVFVCLLGRVVLPPKNGVNLSPESLVKYECVAWWRRRRGRRKGGGVSVKRQYGLVSSSVASFCQVPVANVYLWRLFNDVFKSLLIALATVKFKRSTSKIRAGGFHIKDGDGFGTETVKLWKTGVASLETMEPSDVVYKCSGLVSFGGEVTKVHNVPLECINTKNVAKIEKLVPSFGHAEKECWYDFAHYTRAGIYGKWLTASTTWIKHYENKGNNIDSHQQKLQRVVAGPGEKKETKIDQGSLEIVAGKVNSTRVASFISRVTMEKTQLTPRVVVGYEKGSNGNLGSTMYPDFSGIMEQVTRANVGHGRIIVMLFVCLAGTSTGIGSSQNLGRERSMISLKIVMLMHTKSLKRL